MESIRALGVPEHILWALKEAKHIVTDLPQWLREEWVEPLPQQIPLPDPTDSPPSPVADTPLTFATSSSTFVTGASTSVTDNGDIPGIPIRTPSLHELCAAPSPDPTDALSANEHSLWRQDRDATEGVEGP